LSYLSKPWVDEASRLDVIAYEAALCARSKADPEVNRSGIRLPVLDG